MKIAFVYDRVNKFGGAERVLLALHKIWPKAPLFTAVYNPPKASWASVFQVKTSFLRYLPFSSSRHEILPFLAPLAFESFDFSHYDVVLSVTSSDAKCIVTRPQTLHVCYCLTPTRYLWNGYRDYLDEPGLGIFNPTAQIMMKLFTPILRRKDFISAQRPDIYLTISKAVATRINHYYKKEVEVIYPPIDIDKFKPSKNKTKNGYFLIVSRLVPYKKIDYVISSFNKLDWKLKIIGSGIDKNRLEKLAKSDIEFLGDLTDKKLCWYYQNCRALIFPGEEDFGLTSLEAQACGKPVIAYKSGGVKETVIDRVTGSLYDSPTEDSLVSALKEFNENDYLPFVCRQNAQKFSQTIFQKQMKKTIETFWKIWIRKT